MLNKNNEVLPMTANEVIIILNKIQGIDYRTYLTWF